MTVDRDEERLTDRRRPGLKKGTEFDRVWLHQSRIPEASTLDSGTDSLVLREPRGRVHDMRSSRQPHGVR